MPLGFRIKIVDPQSTINARQGIIGSMGHKIFTKNIYINHSLNFIFRGYRNERNLCILDIDSFHSFSSLLQTLENSHLKDCQEITLIKGSGIHSRVLSPLATFSYDERIREIISCLGQTPPPQCQWGHIRKHLTMLQRWSIMRPDEMDIIRLIIKSPDIATIASALNSNTKSIYSKVRVIARKLNLRNINDIRRLVIAESAYL